MVEESGIKTDNSTWRLIKPDVESDEEIYLAKDSYAKERLDVPTQQFLKSLTKHSLQEILALLRYGRTENERVNLNRTIVQLNLDETYPPAPIGERVSGSIG